MGLYQAECTDMWNRYFDDHGVDFILTPSMWGDSMDWQGMIHNKCVCASPPCLALLSLGKVCFPLESRWTLFKSLELQ